MSHTYTHLVFHLVFSTKGRLGLIQSGEIENRLHSYIAGYINNEFGHVLEINGTSNHLHILLDLKATHSIAEVMRRVKSDSSKWLVSTFQKLRGFHWLVGYGAFSVSASAEEKVASYIKNQKEHHQTMSFKTELVALFRRHGMEFDEDHLWD